MATPTENITGIKGSTYIRIFLISLRRIFKKTSKQFANVYLIQFKFNSDLDKIMNKFDIIKFATKCLFNPNLIQI